MVGLICMTLPLGPFSSLPGAPGRAHCSEVIHYIYLTAHKTIWPMNTSDVINYLKI